MPVSRWLPAGFAVFLLLMALGCAKSNVADAGVGPTDAERMDAGLGDPGGRDAGLVDSGGQIASRDQGPLPECGSTLGDFCRTDADCLDDCGCNGAEVCNGVICASAALPLCDDGISCTVDSCRELRGGRGECANVPSDAICDDGNVCTGVETCDVRIGCIAGLGLICPRGFPNVPSQCIEFGCDPVLACFSRFIDGDGDGYGPDPLCGNDCNDADPAVHPGAEEDCEGVRDLDCDGAFGAADADCAE